jgi:acetyl esterase/lipase
MDEDVAMFEAMNAEFMAEAPALGFDSVEMYRGMFEMPEGMEDMPTGFEQWTEQVERVESQLNNEGDAVVRSIVHIPNEKRHDNGKNCGIMFFHGGGGVMSAPDDVVTVCDRLAVETGCHIFNTGYRLAPEHPAPAGMEDGYNGFTWLAETGAKDFGVDSEKLAYGGASGGGWIASGVGMMLA